MPEKNKLRVSPVGRLSFPSLFEPKTDQRGTKNYEATLIFPAGTDLSEIETAIDEAAEIKWGLKKAAMLKKVKHFPIKKNEDCTDTDGNRRGGYEDGEGQHCKFKNGQKPNVVGRERDPENPTKFLELTKDEVYSGCYGRASYTCYAGEFKGDDGVTSNYVRLSLQNFQLVKDGEPLSGFRSNPEDDFADDEADEADEAVEAALA